MILIADLNVALGVLVDEALRRSDQSSHELLREGRDVLNGVARTVSTIRRGEVDALI